MKIEQLANDVFRLSLWPLDLLNMYLVGDILIDSGISSSRKSIMEVLKDKNLRALALTHAHFDHQGCAHEICKNYGIPLYCGEGDREAMESGKLNLLLPEPESITGKIGQFFAGAPHPVAATLKEGDEVSGFSVIETPGHTPGHLSFWREMDKVLILGDVLFHRNPLTLVRGLCEPFKTATYDLQRNRDSAKKLAALQPGIICFGHGRPLTDVSIFQDFVKLL